VHSLEALAPDDYDKLAERAELRRTGKRQARATS
jgi:hypothetical protein